MSGEAHLALLARMLHRVGYDDHITGHISVRCADETYLFTPRLFAWDEMTAGDIVRVDGDGRVLEGRRTVTVASALHFAVYGARDDVGVVIHGHPEHATLWSTVPAVPPPYDQTSAMSLADDEIGLLETYEHVEDPGRARAAADALGSFNVLLLAHHGVLVVGAEVASAHQRAATFEHRCRIAWRHRVAGPAEPLPDDARLALGRTNPYADGSLYDAMVRRELRADRSVIRVG